jgi:two-component system response regulator AlgR
VRTSSNEYLIEESLKSLESEFADSFLRIHRNALVARAFIRGVDRDDEGHTRILLHGIDDRLEVSRRHVAAVKALLKQGV